MTDRHSGYVVILDRDLHEDDAEQIRQALELTKGVVSVTPVLADLHVHIAQDREGARWRARLLDLVEDMQELPR